jgi:hypothetical protein
MALATDYVINSLKQTIENLLETNDYQWGHMGACNCGHLARVVTNFTRAEIHQYALLTQEGDWNDMLNAYCTVSEAPIDMVISEMVNKGFSTSDLKHLEYLSDPKILQTLGITLLNRNKKEDLILYLNTWVDLLEEQKLKYVPTHIDLAEVLR